MALVVHALFGLYGIALQTSMALMEICGWTLFAVALFQFIRRGAPWRELKTGVEIPLAILLFCVVQGAIRAVQPDHRPIDMIGWARWMLLLYAYVYLLRNWLTPKWEKGYLFWLGLAILNSIHAFVQSQWGLELHHHLGSPLSPMGSHFRASSFFDLSLTLAYAFGMVGMTALGAALVYWGCGRRKAALYALAAYFAVAIAVGVTYARGAWISYSVASAALVLIFWPRRGIALVAAGAVALAALIASVPLLRMRFLTVFDMHMESNSLRLLIWKANWLMFKDHPILGLGFWQNTKWSPVYYAKLGAGNIDFYGHAHNNILQFMSTTGIVGTIAYLWFCWFFLQKAWQLYRKADWNHAWYKAIGLGSLGAQIHLHVGGLTEANFINTIVNHNLIFIWAATLAAWTQLAKPSPKTQ